MHLGKSLMEKFCKWNWQKRVLFPNMNLKIAYMTSLSHKSVNNQSGKQAWGSLSWYYHTQTYTFINIARRNSTHTTPSFSLPTNAADTTDLSTTSVAPQFHLEPLGHISSQSSWHALNQNGSFLPWNGCLCRIDAESEERRAWKWHLYRGRGCSVSVGAREVMHVCSSVWVYVCLCILS